MHSPIGVLADVDATGHAGCFGATRQVDRVAKEAIPGHTIADDAGDHLARMDANRDLL